MKILLDTNIIIHRETKDPINKDIGTLFRWIDKLRYQKCIHQVTLNEISSNQDGKAREAFLVKMKSYHCLPTVASLRPEAQSISEKYDKTENDSNDTILINELLCGRVDLLITEDRILHTKALALGVDSSVFTIDGFLEKVTAENPSLLDYKVLSVRREYFGNVHLEDSFFDSFKEDYVDYERWFNRKSDEPAYVCMSDENIVAFLYVKVEDASEPYTDITPPFTKKRRLKIGTFKVQSNGVKLGERLLKIVFDNALHLSVNEILLVVLGWQKIYRGGNLLVTNGIYRHIRHPQCLGILLVAAGWVVHWPTIPGVGMFPILAILYYDLARREDKFLEERFGHEFREYEIRTPRILPRLRSPDKCTVP